MVVSTKTIDVAALEAWRNEEGFPILSFVAVYGALGLTDDILSYVKEHATEDKEDSKIIAMQQIFCSFATLQKIRRIISHNWEHFNIDIQSDNHIEWKKDKSRDHLSYSRTLSNRIKASITQDFMNYGCGIDDTLEENVIVFTDGTDNDDTNSETE